MAKEEKGDSDSLFGPGFHQTIALTGRERAYTVHNYEVVIHASPSSSISNNSTSGSSNVQVSTITNQSWELPVHPGNMVASNSNYIAYVLEGRSGYVVRLIHRHTNSRTLLKGFTGPVLDVAFSPSAASLLACVDQGGNLFVWDLSKTDSGLSDVNSTLRLHSERSSAPDHTHHRLSWCPYVAQEEGEDEEEGWLLAASHGCEVEVYNLGQLLPASGSGGESPVVLHGGDEAPGRFIMPSPHSKPVYDMSISPDGGVLATSSEDGHLKFWQINWDNVVPETLHDFSPHGGEAVTRLIFCDDHTTRDELAQYWRFLITGANGNREVKLWCTVTWRCLQTFHFLPPEEGSSDSSEPNILLNLDTSASYLIATDTRRMTLYVFQLVMDGLGGQASFTSITEYLLTQPVLSFVIAGHAPCPSTNEVTGGGESGEEGEGERAELSERANRDSRLVAVHIKLFCIHTRSMQELQVKFEPPDIMGVPPDPLPIPLFSGTMFFSETKSTEKPAANSEPVSNGQVDSDGGGREGEVEEEEEEEEDDGANSPVDRLSQPASLPSSFHPITPVSGSAIVSEPFLSLPSLPGMSPKLVTPSDFLSAAKIDMSPSHKSTSPPSLLPSSPSFLPSSPSLSPSTNHPSHLPNTTTVSVSPGNTLTSVTPSLEPSDTTFDSTHLIGEAPPLGTPMEWMRAPPGEVEGDENKDDDEKERSIGREREREERGGEEEEGEEEEKLLSDVEELHVSQLVDEHLRRPASPGDEEQTEKESAGSVQEKFSEIFGMAGALDSSLPEGGLDFQPLDGSPEGVGNLNGRPSPLRPQQMFTSTEKSEIVTISRKALTPTREEGTEVVNTTGTPSAEFMELLSHQQSSRKGSKVTTPQGETGNDEMMSGFSAPSWMDKMSDNAASAWPDLGASNIPKLVSQDEEEIETSPTDSAHGVGPGNEEGEAGGKIEIDPSHEVRHDEGSVSGETMNLYSGLFPSALPPTVTTSTPLETGVPLARGAETTEGETGQMLPLTAEHVAPPEHGLLSAAALLPPLLGDEVEGGEGVREGTVEESTGAKTSRLVELQPSPPPPDTELPQLVPRGGGGEGEMPATRARKRKKMKTKQQQQQQQPTMTVPTAGDGEGNRETRGPLAQQHFPPPPAGNGVEPVGVADHTHHLAQLYQLVASQQREIAELQAEVRRGFSTTWRQLAAVQSTVTEEQNRVLAEHAREQQQRLDKVLKEKQLVDRQRQDKLISTVSQTLTSAVHVKLEKVVKSEMKTHVTPAVSRSLGSVQDQLTATVQSATDTALKDGIASILHTKGLPEAVGTAVAGSIRSNIQGKYDETFRKVVLPAFERSSQEMFRQVDEAFRRGIAEYLSQLQQQFHQLSEPALQHLASSYHSLHSLLTSPDSPLVTSLQREIRTTMQSVLQGVGESVRGVVREEIDSALQKHAHSISPEARAMEERARKEEIQRLVQSQELNRAFETALSTSDLSLVLYLCQQVTPEDVFDKTPCPLSQPVLLSLVQQLSVDLSEHVDLKLRFLEASVLGLDVNNDITKSHMTQVLRTLTQQLAGAEQANRSVPNSAALLRSVRRLRMVTESLCPPIN